MDNASDHPGLLALTSEIVAAFVGRHTVASSELPGLIESVFMALGSAGQAEVTKAPEALIPAVPIKRSVGTDYLVCLEDGKKLKMLKRYLRTRYSMTPDEYRQRWGLAADYPMVAPAYAEQRSTMAKQLGFGRKPAPALVVPEPTPAAPERSLRVGGRRKSV